MTVPVEVWLTLGYLAGGIVISFSACLFGAFMGKHVIGWFADAFDLFKL